MSQVRRIRGVSIVKWIQAAVSTVEVGDFGEQEREKKIRSSELVVGGEG
jgi:hypothetical protein